MSNLRKNDIAYKLCMLTKRIVKVKIISESLYYSADDIGTYRLVKYLDVPDQTNYNYALDKFLFALEEEAQFVLSLLGNLNKENFCGTVLQDRKP